MKTRQILVVEDERIVAEDIKMRDKDKGKHNFLDYAVTKKYRKFF